MAKSNRPSWDKGLKKKRGKRRRLPKHTHILQTAGKFNERRLHNEVVKHIFFSLGENAWAPKHGQLAPILEELSSHRGIPAKTLRRWYDHFLLYGETRPETDIWEQQGFIRKEETGAGKWSQNDSNVLDTIVRLKPWLFLDEIRDFLLASTGKLWSISTIHGKIKELGLSLQVVSVLAKERNEEHRSNYKSSLEHQMMNPEQLLFLDETAKGRNGSRRRRFWSPKGVTPIASASFEGSHGKRYSMLSACDIDGFIMETCKVVERDGAAGMTVDTEVFTHWLFDNVVPLLGDYWNGDPRSIVVLDNASIHHSDEIVELIESTGAKIIYLSPYSPDLNSIELMFGQHKQGLKRYQGDDWWTAHAKALGSVKPHHARNYFRKCGVPDIGGDTVEEEGELCCAMAAFAAAMFLV